MLEKCEDYEEKLRRNCENSCWRLGGASEYFCILNGSGFPENFPFADIDRMISDAFEVFGQHQGIEALYRIGTIFFYVDNDIILYLIKKLVDDIIGSDDIIRFF